MPFPLTATDGPCPDHKDCTATTFSNSKGVIGVRHLHQWLDKPGLAVGDGRADDDLVFGAWNVGILYDYNEDTGEAEFDPDAQILTASRAPDHIEPEGRLNETYPVADDHRKRKDRTGNHPKLRHPTAS